MKKAIVFCVVILPVLASCTTPHEAKTDLFDRYLQYKTQMVFVNPTKLMTLFFSNEYREGAKQAPVDIATQNTQLLNILDQVASHFERHEGKTACLTMNGYDKKGRPLIESLRYVREQQKWMIDYSQIMFLNHSKQFVSHAYCPGDFGTDFFFEEKK